MKLTLSSSGGSLSYEVQKEQISIGRDSANDWVIPHDKLSRIHCIFHHSKDRMAIRDPGSKNGVIVDGVRIEPETLVPVNAGSIIILANQFYLSIDCPAKRKIEMIGDGGASAPIKLKPKTIKKIEEEKEPIKKKGFSVPFFLISILILAALLAFYYQERGL